MERFKNAMHRMSKFVFQLCTLFEGIISLIILLCIGIELISLINNYEVFTMDLSTVHLRSMLSDIMWLVIGLEFIKMLLEHSQGAVLDVMLFAVARQMLLEHSMVESLLGVVAIVLVFATRKFLYDQTEDREPIMDSILHALKSGRRGKALEESAEEELENSEGRK